MKKLILFIFLFSFPVCAQSLNSSSIDVLEGRLGEMETVLMQQTDTIERLNHRIDQLERRLNQVNADIDVRFDELKKPAQPAMTPVTTAPVATPTPIPASASSPKELYDRGMDLIRSGKYAEAGKDFDSFLSLYPNHELAANAQYWLGETYYARGDFQNAAVVFAEGFQKYPKGQKAADNLLKLGLSMQALKKNKEACTAFMGVQKEFPKAPENILSKARTESKKLSCK